MIDSIFLNSCASGLSPESASGDFFLPHFIILKVWHVSSGSIRFLTLIDVVTNLSQLRRCVCHSSAKLITNWIKKKAQALSSYLHREKNLLMLEDLNLLLLKIFSLFVSSFLARLDIYRTCQSNFG